MKRNIINYPPAWFPNAVPSDRGWRHPVTGELLVSIRGGVKPIQDDQSNQNNQNLIREMPRSQPVLQEADKQDVIDENQKQEIILDQNDLEQNEKILTETKQQQKKGKKHVRKEK